MRHPEMFFLYDMIKIFLSENPEIMIEIENRIWGVVHPEEDAEQFTEADDEPISIED